MNFSSKIWVSNKMALQSRPQNRLEVAAHDSAHNTSYNHLFSAIFFRGPRTPCITMGSGSIWYFEDHAMTCKWLGFASLFIYQIGHLEGGPTTRSLGDLLTTKPWLLTTDKSKSWEPPQRCVGLPAIHALIECLSWRMVCRCGVSFPSLFWKFREEEGKKGGEG